MKINLSLKITVLIPSHYTSLHWYLNVRASSKKLTPWINVLIPTWAGLFWRKKKCETKYKISPFMLNEKHSSPVWIFNDLFIYTVILLSPPSFYYLLIVLFTIIEYKPWYVIFVNYCLYVYNHILKIQDFLMLKAISAS